MDEATIEKLLLNIHKDLEVLKVKIEKIEDELNEIKENEKKENEKMYKQIKYLFGVIIFLSMIVFSTEPEKILQIFRFLIMP